MKVIEALGRSWRVESPPHFIARWRHGPAKARPVYALGCERCEMLCLLRVSECDCCKRYKKRTAGGTPLYPTVSGGYGLFEYDPNAPGHVAVMSFENLVKELAA